ncbi:hypothetical protein [Deinococcus altitudinis]|uniref:hypothetical protein n=1 Tax=Deinococcus altitudinis TaxID=468914 RepID=UPI00389244DE
MKWTHLKWAVVTTVFTVPAAGAQDFQVQPVLDPTLMTGWAGGAAVQYDLEKRAAAAGKTTAAANLAYTPTPALKKATVAGYVSRLKASDPAASKAVAAAFAPGKYDYASIYSGLAKGYGLKDNDATDVMTVYLVLGYVIVNNVQDDKALTPKMVQGVRSQFGPQLAKNPKLTAPGVAGQLGEEMKLQTVIVHGGWQAAIKEKTLPAYQQGIATMFKTQWGLDLKSVRLTAQGFARK